jgi:hypothetical protein
MPKMLVIGALLTAAAVVGQERSLPKPEGKRPVDAPPQAPLVFDVDVRSLELQPTDRPGVFESTPFHIEIGSIVPRWRISAIPGPVSVPAGADRGITAPPRVSLVPERALGNPGKAYTGGPIALDATAVVAAGGATGGRIREVNAYRVMVENPPAATHGRYRGSLRLVPEVPGGGRAPYDVEMSYDWVVLEHLSVTVASGQTLEFGDVIPGIHESVNHSIIEVYSNYTEAEVEVQMQPLVDQEAGVELPPTATCIGWGPDVATARENAASAPFGRNKVTIVTGPGHPNSFAICGRLQLTFEDRAGRYDGQIVITSRVIQ